MSLLGVLLAVLLLAIVIWLVASRFQDGTGGAGPAALGVQGPVSSLNFSLQQQTMANMELIARTNDLRYAESGSYAERLADLETRGQRMANDSWGNPYVYTCGADSYTLTSLGSDGAPGPSPPDPWRGSPYEPDLVMVTGRFTQAPRPLG